MITLPRLALAFSLLLITLLGIGFFFPHSLLWGFHFLGFLPPYVFILFMVAGIAIIVSTYKGYTEQLFEKITTFVEKRPILFLTLSCGLFIIVATLLRVKVPLLGDSFILLNNYELTFSGDHSLHLFRSPLAFSYFYIFADLFKTPAFPEILDSFLVGELILAVIVIVSTFFITKLLFDTSREQVFTFCFLLTLPYMQIFFGYAELYSVVFTTLVLFVLVSLLYLKGKIPFYILPPVYFLLYSANYLNIIIFPALLYTLYLEFRNGKKWTIALGIGLCAVLFVGALTLVNFDIHRFLQSDESGHWLSVTHQPGDQFQAYPLFSIFHINDIANIVVLLGAGAVFFVIATLFQKSNFPILNEINGFFISATLLFLGFISVVKLDLGFPNDWDVSASYFFVLNLFALRLFFKTSSDEKIRSALMIGGTTLLISLSWFALNSTTEPAIRRSESLNDHRIMSPSGLYQSMFHISKYYSQIKQYDKEIDVWKRYESLYPADVRGLQNLATACYEGGEAYDSLSIQTYKKLIAIDSVHNNHKINYANFLAERGIMNYQRKSFTTAEHQFKEALNINPDFTSTYNNLASLYLDTNNPDSAIEYCNRAIVINPGYTLSYHNLANAYAQKTELDTAIMYYQKAISIDAKYIPAFENMSKVYYRKGDRGKAIEILRQAARLGSKTAQSLLSMSGVQW